MIRISETHHVARIWRLPVVLNMHVGPDRGAHPASRSASAATRRRSRISPAPTSNSPSAIAKPESSSHEARTGTVEENAFSNSEKAASPAISWADAISFVPHFVEDSEASLKPKNPAAITVAVTATPAVRTTSAGRDTLGGASIRLIAAHAPNTTNWNWERNFSTLPRPRLSSVNLAICDASAESLVKHDVTNDHQVTEGSEIVVISPRRSP